MIGQSNNCVGTPAHKKWEKKSRKGNGLSHTILLFLLTVLQPGLTGACAVDHSSNGNVASLQEPNNNTCPSHTSLLELEFINSNATVDYSVRRELRFDVKGSDNFGAEAQMLELYADVKFSICMSQCFWYELSIIEERDHPDAPGIIQRNANTKNAAMGSSRARISIDSNEVWEEDLQSSRLDVQIAFQANITSKEKAFQAEVKNSNHPQSLNQFKKHARFLQVRLVASLFSLHPTTNLPLPHQNTNVFINEFAVSGLDLSLEATHEGDASAYAIQFYSTMEGVLGGAQACSASINLDSFSAGTPNNGLHFASITVTTTCEPFFPPDAYGVVLYNTETGSVVEFVSTEASLTAGSGPAAGLTSVVVGTIPGAGSSLQRTGLGCEMADFSWTTAPLTLGSSNVGQQSTCTTSPPSNYPSERPSSGPSKSPSPIPSDEPSTQPSMTPSSTPSSYPSTIPSDGPSGSPSENPSSTPSLGPSNHPSSAPSMSPSDKTDGPSSSPSEKPSSIPSLGPSGHPSSFPSMSPSDSTDGPSSSPSENPSSIPSLGPSDHPSNTPSMSPSDITGHPSSAPSESPSSMPSRRPSDRPSSSPSTYPSLTPSQQPSQGLSMQPSKFPSRLPSGEPSIAPSQVPSGKIPQCSSDSRLRILLTKFHKINRVNFRRLLRRLR